ncbi:MAG: aminomethyl-transferring glycine dehydrogenase [Planctomycetota bacterium]
MTASISRPSQPEPSRTHGATPVETFPGRHIGPRPADIEVMLDAIGAQSLDVLIDEAVPGAIRSERVLSIGPARHEADVLEELRSKASKNRVLRSYIGLGYHGTVTPPVILRNVLENPGWYTQYTPYQAEIAQGRLEALLNFQTAISDLTGLPLAGASLLDEATAAAEAMAMCFAIAKGKRTRFVVDRACHPQTIAVIETRAEPLDIELTITDPANIEFDESIAGVLLQYPATDGDIVDPSAVIERAHAAGALAVMSADPLALALLTPPGELGADIAVGSTQRFGVPLGYGGPHAAYIATHEQHARKLPGRIIGVSRDTHGDRALRMAIQTREQHIKRERATSNICTAQALLAIIAGMYCVYHGPEGLRRIAERIRFQTGALRSMVEAAGHKVLNAQHFDSLRIRPSGTTVSNVMTAALSVGINLRDFGDGTVGVSLDETVGERDLEDLAKVFGANPVSGEPSPLPEALIRQSGYLTHEVFQAHRSETEMLRYIFELQERDLSLAHSMIPLGSCTMKLNATSEMQPIGWPEFSSIHPFAPAEQASGYTEMFEELERWLCDITGFAAVSLQPNAGAQGEYAGLLTIRAYHRNRGDHDRNVCLIPVSAHGTNPASAVMAGFEVVSVKCDKYGDTDLDDLRAKAEKHAGRVGALMITYPSTHGVFEPRIKEVIEFVHESGGLVYMDGANLNAQVGLTSPGEIGADVCHLNLHKTFCIPHGGGGPGMGPIAVNERLKPFLPTHPVVAPKSAGLTPIGPVSAAPYGSASILPISWVYIAAMGSEGLKKATEVAILNANYMAKRLESHYDIVYTGKTGRVAHEFIVDCRPYAKGGELDAGIVIDDIAKRLIDYGFHGPTMSWPVAGTLMVEPTESEPKAELDRFCDAMIAIRAEIERVRTGDLDAENNPLKNAPHTAACVSSDAWDRPYARAEGAYPAPWLRRRKFWPAVGRVDNPFGDRNLICTCPSVEELAQA